ncbi:hypothetical protein, partial [Paraburkholderia sp. SIMBA_053]|uniref:hypothetical protein n=1 Tax=Paraburkholderia sp. SIMBA_053 TaxID=3085794 RepID=UPI0039784E82
PYRPSDHPTGDAKMSIENYEQTGSCATCKKGAHLRTRRVDLGHAPHSVFRLNWEPGPHLQFVRQ